MHGTVRLFPVFISPIVWNMCENLHYESVYFKEPRGATQPARILLTDNIQSALLKIAWVSCIFTRSYQLSHPFPFGPFDYKYTCRRVKWAEHGTYDTLTTLP